MGKFYTQEQKNWLIERANKYNYPKLTEMFNEAFNENRSVTAIERQCRDRLGVRHSVAYGYTAEEDEWLLANAMKYSCKKLSVLLEKELGTHHTAESIKEHCREKLCIKKAHGFQYEDTHANKLPIGTITKQAGKTYIKVDGKAYETHRNNFMPYGKYLYEQAYGKQPKGVQIIHLDGNNENFDLENLKAVSKEAHCQLANNGLFGLGKLTSVAIDCYELAMICKGIR